MSSTSITILFYVKYENSGTEDKITVVYDGITAKINNKLHANQFSTNRKKCRMNSYFTALYIKTLKISDTYRILATKFLCDNLVKYLHCNLRLKVILYDGKDPIDYVWCDIITRLCYEKREINNIMAWLSTFGGAFSALGDHYKDHATIAGRISMEQFKLALRLGDPPILARCQLFYAYSLIQRGFLKKARKIIIRIHTLAINKFAEDIRLRRMCLGMWSRLRYEWAMRSQKLKTRILNIK